MSSAESRSPRDSVVNVHMIPRLTHMYVLFIIQSIVRQNRNGDNIYPCFTPVMMSNYSVKCWPHITFDLNPSYNIFMISALTPSAPGTFPDFMLSIADFTSFAVGGSMLTSRSSSLSGMSCTSLGASLLRIVSKCVFHSSVCFYTLVITTPSAYFIGMSQFLKPPANALVILYSIAIFCICAAVSALSARFSTNVLLSAFVFLFTSLSIFEYLV